MSAEDNTAPVVADTGDILDWDFWMDAPAARRVREILVRFERVQAVYMPAAEAYRRAVEPQVRVVTSDSTVWELP